MAEALSETLRIFHCMRAPVGGLFRHVCDLAREQARLGHEIGVICDSQTGNLFSEQAFERLKMDCHLGVYRLAISRGISWRDLTVYHSIKKIVREARVDILHGHGAKGGAYARLAAGRLKRKGIPLAVFYTPHGGSLHYLPASLEGWFFHKLERRLLAITDGLIFESRYTSKVYQQKIGYPGCAVRQIPNGISADEFYQTKARQGAADFLFIGELRFLKGADLFLQALAELHKRRPVSAVIFGDGPDKKLLQKTAHDLGLSEHVHFSGAKTTAEAFPCGRCLVVPSRAESLPYIVLEGAAAQMPLIMTDVGGIPEIVAGTACGLVSAEDPLALCQEMEKFLQRPDDFSAQAKRLKDHVRKNFSVKKMTEAVIDFYFSEYYSIQPIKYRD